MADPAPKQPDLDPKAPTEIDLVAIALATIMDSRHPLVTAVAAIRLAQWSYGRLIEHGLTDDAETVAAIARQAFAGAGAKP
jgi:hypothetical protein